ncbi:LPS export ABC transporter periplasmic protein LptC [Salibacteraceae bacterium]|nr:LPS export ABC transporter periplasmic protein LptC [Salibacteraceae bacterium]
MSHFVKLFNYVAATFVVAIFFMSCSSENSELPDLNDEVPKPVEISINTTILYSDSAVLRLKIVTPELQRWTNLETPYVEFPKGLNLFFYDSLGNVESTLKADYAINYTEDKRVEVKHNVEVVNGKEEILNTEHLIWLQKEEKIYTKEFVKITTPDEIIYGDGLEANQQFTKYRIKNIKGTIAVDEDSLQ